jgi:hypothetical protein
VHDAVESNMPYDRFVREILLARGSNLKNGPTNFYRIEQSAENRMETVGQAFLGLRMACARCHKNPFDRWTTDDYWNFAAFMGKVAARPGQLSDEAEVFYASYGEVRNASVTGRNRARSLPRHSWARRSRSNSRSCRTVATRTTSRSSPTGRSARTTRTSPKPR